MTITWKAWHYQFDLRQLKEIELAIQYEENFNHGTDGHNAEVIISRLAKLLDEIEEALDVEHPSLTYEDVYKIINRGIKENNP